MKLSHLCALALCGLLFWLNLKKSAFLVIWSSFGVPSVVSRSSLGKTRQGIREGKS